MLVLSPISSQHLFASSPLSTPNLQPFPFVHISAHRLKQSSQWSKSSRSQFSRSLCLWHSVPPSLPEKVCPSPQQREEQTHWQSSKSALVMVSSPTVNDSLEVLASCLRPNDQPVSPSLRRWRFRRPTDDAVANKAKRSGSPQVAATQDNGQDIFAGYVRPLRN